LDPGLTACQDDKGNDSFVTVYQTLLAASQLLESVIPA